MLASEIVGKAREEVSDLAKFQKLSRDIRLLYPEVTET